MAEPLHLRYRPRTWDDVIGQPEIVASLANLIDRREQHAFLLVGPSGCGKTTLARIAATSLGCNEPLEVDAARFTGVDDMRRLTDMLSYIPLSGDTVVYIIDEAHALSAHAWRSLLKSVEEPPDWAYWFFCTTDGGKVPPTIMTRCTHYVLKPLAWQTLLDDLVRPVAQLEELTAPDEVLGMCARVANGSPRQALVNLAACGNVDAKEQAATLLQQIAEEAGDASFRLAKALAEGKPWEALSPILGELKDENPEGVRHVVRAYMTTLLLNAKGPKAAMRSCAVLDAFAQPFPSNEGISPLALAVGRITLLS